MGIVSRVRARRSPLNREGFTLTGAAFNIAILSVLSAFSRQFLEKFHGIVSQCSVHERIRSCRSCDVKKRETKQTSILNETKLLRSCIANGLITHLAFKIVPPKPKRFRTFFDQRCNCQILLLVRDRCQVASQGHALCLRATPCQFLLSDVILYIFYNCVLLYSTQTKQSNNVSPRQCESLMEKAGCGDTKRTNTPQVGDSQPTI